MQICGLDSKYNLLIQGYVITIYFLLDSRGLDTLRYHAQYDGFCVIFWTILRESSRQIRTFFTNPTFALKSCRCCQKIAPNYR